jgi:hypothetical protein
MLPVILAGLKDRGACDPYGKGGWQPAWLYLELLVSIHHLYNARYARRAPRASSAPHACLDRGHTRWRHDMMNQMDRETAPT